MKQRLRDTVALMDHTPIEILSAISAIFWGVFVANPFTHSFCAMGVGVVLERVAPEWVWGVVAALIGMKQLHAVLCRDTFWRTYTAIAIVILWVFMFVSFLLAAPQSVSIIVYPILAVAESWAMLRLTGRIGE